MPLLELVWRTSLALLLGGAQFYVTLRITLAFGVGRSIFLAGATFLAVGLCGAALFFHLLIALHLYTLPCALLLSLLACLVAARCTRRAGSTAHALGQVGRALGRLRVLLGRSRHRWKVCFFVANAVVLGSRTLLFHPNSHDTVVYHATKAALWIQKNDLGAMWGPGPWGLYGLFPGGAELYGSLAMLPFRADLYACAVDTLMWLGLGFAALASSRELGLREPYGSIAAGFLLGVPTFRLLVGSGYIEPALCFAFVLGVYFVLRFLRDPRGPIAMLAVATLGVAASTKFSIMAPAAVGGVVVLARALTLPARRWSLLAWALAGCALALCAIAPWLLNSMRYTGYPLSPLPFQVAGVTLGVGSMLEVLQSSPIPTPYTWESEWPVAKATFSLPVGPLKETVGIFSAIVVVLAPLGWAGLARRRPLHALVLMLFSAVCAWTYLEPRMAHVRFLWVDSSSRFLLPFLCMAAQSALLFAPRGRAIVWVARVLWAGFVVNAIYAGLPWPTRYDAYGVPLVLAMLAASLVISRWARARWAGRPALLLVLHAALAIAFTAGLYEYKEPRRYEFVRNNTVLHPYDRRWWMTARRIDEAAGERRRIAITSGTEGTQRCVWLTYYFLGRRLQNELVYVSPLPDGRTPDLCPSNGWEPEARFDVWLARLRAQGVHDVVTLPPASVELRWMLQHPEIFESVLLYAQEGGYFRLRPPGEARAEIAGHVYGR